MWGLVTLAPAITIYGDLKVLLHAWYFFTHSTEAWRCFCMHNILFTHSRWKDCSDCSCQWTYWDVKSRSLGKSFTHCYIGTHRTIDDCCNCHSVCFWFLCTEVFSRSWPGSLPDRQEENIAVQGCGYSREGDTESHSARCWRTSLCRSLPFSWYVHFNALMKDISLVPRPPVLGFSLNVWEWG